MTPADAYCHAARARFDNEEFADAVELCRQGLLHAPDHPELLQLSGMSHLELGDWERALADLENASALAVLSPLAQLVLAAIYREKCWQPKTALAMYEFLAEPGRCPTPLLPELARGLGRLGAYPQALRTCLRLIELRPCFHQAQFGAAFYLVQLGAPAEQVLPYVRRAFELSPETISYRISFALLCVRANQWREAYTLLRPASPEEVHCPDCIRQVLAVLSEAKDDCLILAWQARLQTLAPCGKTAAQ